MSQRSARERSLNGQVAGLSRTLKPGYSGRAATQAARDAYKAQQAAELDPLGQMSADELKKALARAFTLKMAKGKLRRATARRRKGSRR